MCECVQGVVCVLGEVCPGGEVYMHNPNGSNFNVVLGVGP